MWRRDVTVQNFEVLKKEIVMSLSHFKHILVINIICLLIHYGMVSSPPKYRISLLQLQKFWFSMSEGKNLRVTMRALILCNKNQNKMIQLDFRQVGYNIAECCTMGLYMSIYRHFDLPPINDKLQQFNSDKRPINH